MLTELRNALRRLSHRCQLSTAAIEETHQLAECAMTCHAHITCTKGIFVETTVSASYSLATLKAQRTSLRSARETLAPCTPNPGPIVVMGFSAHVCTEPFRAPWQPQSWQCDADRPRRQRIRRS